MDTRGFLKIFLGVSVLLVIILVTALFLSCWKPWKQQESVSTLRINDTEITIYSAQTWYAHARGLSGIASIGKNEGALYVFPDGTSPKFWMKDMLFPLDIIWIRSDGTIVGITENISPSTYPELFSPTEPIRYVLEVNAEFMREHNIVVGDVVYQLP